MAPGNELWHEMEDLEIRWDDTLETVVMDYSGFLKGEEYRTGLDKGLELLRERESENWYADLRELGTVAEDDQQWTSEQWFPRAIEAGLKNMAIVRPESVVADMSVDNIVTEFEGTDLVMHNFEDPEAAQEWLRDR